MNRIIGGLLVMTLLSRPVSIDPSVYYEKYTTFVQSFEAIKREEDEEISAAKIDDLFKGIEKNNRKIKRLLKSKYDLHVKIQAAMEVRSKISLPMTETQMSAYQSYYSQYSESRIELNLKLDEIERDCRIDGQRESFSLVPNRTSLYNQLKRIYKNQMAAIYELICLVELSSKTFAII